ncbi:MAG: GatB/YqeY domain-containing protein [Candidatus Niyogibacteria bacterium]|nr:MAG: GatB/YqeY domain-containing protein [Candidatus Niyogibacteria bacterium]
MLKKRLEDELKIAMKAGETLKVSVLRMILSAIANKEIEVLKKEVGLSDEEIIDVLSKELKKRKDAVREFLKGGRQEMASKEEKEGEMISAYLPQEISDEDLKRIVVDSVRETGAKGAGDFGKVMKAAMAVLKGKASGDRVAEAVKEKLG